MSRRGRKSPPFSLFSFQDIVTCTTAVIILITLILVLELVTRELTTSSSVASERELDLAAQIAAAQTEITKLQTQLKEQGEVVNELAGASPDRLERDIATITGQLEPLEAELPELQTRAFSQRELHDKEVSQWRDRADDREHLKTVLAEAKRARDETEKLKNENRLVYNAAGNTSKRAWLVEISEGRIGVRPLGHADESVEFAGSWTSAVSSFSAWLSTRSRASEYFVLLVRPTGVVAFRQMQERLTSRGFDYGFDLIGEAQVVEIDEAKQDVVK